MTAEITRSHTRQPWRVMGRRPPLARYLQQLWERRHFIVAEARTKAFSGNRDLLLGNLWLVGIPILQGLTYYLIFGVILKVSRGVENFTGFLLIGVFLFRFTTACLNSGVAVMQQNRGLLNAFAFPRAAVPLSVVLRETLSMGPVVLTLVVLLLVMPPGTSVSATWLLFPLVFALHTLFNLGLVLYTARLGAAVPDLKHLVSFLARIWFYVSGVFFAVETFVPAGPWLDLLQANPLYLVLDMSRDLLLYDALPDARSWVLLTVWALTSPVLGFLYFWQGEEAYGER